MSEEPKSICHRNPNLYRYIFDIMNDVLCWRVWTTILRGMKMDSVGCIWIKMDVNGWKWMNDDGDVEEGMVMDENGWWWWWMKMDGDGWKWMKINENGWWWMKVDGDGCKWTKMDCVGWRWVVMDENGWKYMWMDEWWRWWLGTLGRDGDGWKWMVMDQNGRDCVQVDRTYENGW